MPEVVCYSKRLLNPFSGVVQVLETDKARALSTDGINWRIQIQSEIFRTPWRELEIPANYDRYFIYGVWSKTGELAKVPIHPTLYQEHVEQSAQDIIEQLIRHQNAIPFPTTDSYECWLLDLKEQKPIALINSSTENDKLDFPRSLHWYPCENSDFSFTSNAFQIPQKNVTITLHAKDILDDLVKKHTGSLATAVWVKRDETGSGHLIAHNGKKATFSKDFFSAADFPLLGITQAWESEDAQQLVDDYIKWLSPVLLTLTNISHTTRAQLEIAAQQRPLEVERFHRLYPKIADDSLLKKILVEATMRKNAAPGK